MRNQHKSTHHKPAPRNVPLDVILTDEATFQPRTKGLEPSHVHQLLDAIWRGGKLDPILLWEDPETGKLTVADGHHRLEAYKRANAQKIPALVYRCERRDAVLLSIQDNAKARLPLSYEDKANYAWKLTVLGEHSKATIVKKCGISDRTVANMRKVLKGLKEREEDIPDTWHRAFAERDWVADDLDGWIEKLVKKTTEQCGSALSHLARRCPEALAQVLEISCGDYLAGVMLELGYVDRERDDDDDEF